MIAFEYCPWPALTCAHRSSVLPVTFETFPCDNLIQAMIVVVCSLGRQKIIRRESFSEEKWKKIYYLSNGNGSEMRWLAAFIWGSEHLKLLNDCTVLFFRTISSLVASGDLRMFGEDLFFHLKSPVISNFMFSFASSYAVSDAWNDIYKKSCQFTTSVPACHFPAAVYLYYVLWNS